MKRHLFALGALFTASSFALQAATPPVGEPAPEFTLTDTAGQSHSLSDFKGKVVILEWINHGCPFVVKHYASGNMQKLQAEAAENGVVWLSICSSAPGKQGHMSAADAAAKSKEVGSNATAYLLDEDGVVGKKYGATRTPELFIINEEGILVYKGAIDDKPTASQEDVEGAKNFISAALTEIKGGQPVTVSETQPYGCTIKY